MSKVKQIAKGHKGKRVTVKGQRVLDKKHVDKEGVYLSSTIGKHVSMIAEYRPAPIQQRDHFVGLRVDQQVFEAEKKELIGVVDRYSRFIDHVIELQKDEMDLADWSIARAADRKRK